MATHKISARENQQSFSLFGEFSISSAHHIIICIGIIFKAHHQAMVCVSFFCVLKQYVRFYWVKFVFNENRSKNVYIQSCTKPTNKRNLPVNCLHVYGKQAKNCRFQIKNANQNMANAIDFHMNSQSIRFSLAISIKC